MNRGLCRYCAIKMKSAVTVSLVYVVCSDLLTVLQFWEFQATCTLEQFALSTQYPAASCHSTSIPAPGSANLLCDAGCSVFSRLSQQKAAPSV